MNQTPDINPSQKPDIDPNRVSHTGKPLDTGKASIPIAFRYAIIPLLIMIVAMAFTVIVFEASPHIPLFIGTIIAGLVAHFHGYRWSTIEQGIYRGIRLSLPAIVIIMMIGLIIGSWIGSGVVATMIYYGLKIISPSIFLMTICAICAIVTLAIGNSWSTMGTIGVAGMGIGMSLGIDPAMTAGAVVSGAYFGDKVSPLSDTTNLAAGITHTNLFEHIRYMMGSTLPAMCLALAVYLYLGLTLDVGGQDISRINEILTAIDDAFVITPWLLLIPAVVAILVAKKVPPLPALSVGVILGFLGHIFVQGGEASVAVATLHDGYKIESGNEMIDELFNRGGIESMMYTISLTIVAMCFGGIMEQTGMLKSIVGQILRLAKNARTLIVATIVSAFTTNVAIAEQYVSILLPGRMYADAYKDMGLQSKNLSRALEDGGTMTSVLIPWNTCGVFAASMLGVNAFSYAPYAVLNYATPMIAIVLALFISKLAYIDKNAVVAQKSDYKHKHDEDDDE